MSNDSQIRRASDHLVEVCPRLDSALKRSAIHTPAWFAPHQIGCTTQMIVARDGVRLATDVYLPPRLTAPTIVMRTPYGRAEDGNVGAFLSFARRGYAVVSQDCRGTGDSEPDAWDYYMYESEDGIDLVDWIVRQVWFDGFLGACGGSYVGQTQWCMAMHPHISTIVPEVSGLGVAVNTTRLHMFLNAYARSIGKGDDRVSMPLRELEGAMLSETLNTGYFNEPLYKPLPEAILNRFPAIKTLSQADAQDWLWKHYCSLTCAGRAELVKAIFDVQSVSIREVESLSSIFGHRISHDRHTIPHPRPEEVCRSLNAPVLLRTGWYDWALNDALATWQLIQGHAQATVASKSRLLIAPSAHNVPGYHEGVPGHPELHHAYRLPTNIEMTLQWYATVRNGALSEWPSVVYYLMGANEWRAADAWPPSGVRFMPLYLGKGGCLTREHPTVRPDPDRYTFDPDRPTPTVGGSVLSYVYPPGSVDVSEVQGRPDLVVYESDPLAEDVEVVGPLRLIIYASSSAPDTDFVGRVSDVFPDGRAIQLQSGALRARYRNATEEPQWLEPGKVYRLEIDLWATANRFKAGHKVRLDISSADFPRYDRNSNRGGDAGPPVPALQTIYLDPEHPSHLLIPVLAQP